MNSVRKIVPAVLAALYAGCATQGGGLPREVAEQTLVDRVTDALVAGARAEAGQGDGKALARAGAVLTMTGARPTDPAQEDLALRWASRAQALGEEAPIPYRGRGLGPAYKLGHLPPGGELALEQIFIGGRKAEVSLMPIAPAPLILEIRQEKERVVCRRSAQDPPAKCSWIPVYTGRHALSIRNTGARPADYFIVTN